MLHPHRTEPGHRLQHRAVSAGCPEPFEQRKTPAKDDLAHGPRQTFADIQRVTNPEFPLLAKDFLNRPG